MDKLFSQKLGERLKAARDNLGFTLGEVSEKMGFNNYQTLSSIEDGSREVKAHELAALAKIYLKDINYFLNEDKVVEEKALIYWREAISDQKVKTLKEQEFLKYCNNYYQLEEKAGIEHKAFLPSFDVNPDTFNYEKCEELAIKCSTAMQLGARPACSLDKVLEEKYNVKIIYLDLGNQGSAACSTGYYGSAILINSSEALWRRNYDLAHELFHLLTWDVFKERDVHMACDPNSIIEKWANYFASTLLLPADEIPNEIKKKIVDDKISDLDLIGIAREFLVSTEALIWRLVSLRFIKTRIAEEWLSNSEVRNLDRKIRSGDKKEAPHISDRYVRLAFKAYQQGLISKGKMAEYLNVDRIDLQGKLSEYGYVDGEVYDGTLAIA